MKRQKLFGALDLGGSFLKFAYGNTEKGIIYHDRIQIKEPDNNDFIFDAIKQAVNIINKHEQSVKTFGMGTPG
ncbi:MAG: hypothetical protein PHF36_09190, partial [Candidatus Cloacimonetes bacterium]|nr:hypothetical protein [Candidatus Cloacimonadota bacterium]